MQDKPKIKNQSNDDYKDIIDALKYLEIEARNLKYYDIALSLRRLLTDLEDNSPEEETALSLETEATQYL